MRASHPDLMSAFVTYPEVAQFLSALMREIEEILEHQLVGVYLFGSLTGPDFDRHSDIDVLAVIDEPLAAKETAALANLHQRLAAMPVWCADQLEISYMPLSAVRRHDPADNVHLHLDRGHGKQLEMTPHDEDWIIQRYVLRERGVTLEGPDPKTLIDPLSIDELQGATSILLNTWLAGFVDNAAVVRTVGYQSYLVLTVCRVLFTLLEGEVVSKREAVDWAIETLDARWKAVVEAAWRDRRDPNRQVSPEAIIELQNFIRYGVGINNDTYLMTGRSRDARL